MKNTFKKIGIRVLVLALMLIALNYIYKYFFLESDIQEHSNIVNLVRKVPDSTKVVYIGESSNCAYRSNDIDKRWISDFIADHFPGLPMANITKPASHAGIYYALHNELPSDSEIETVIVTLNLRSFNAQWIYSILETPLQKSIILLNDNPPILNRFKLAFKAYDIKTDKERSSLKRNGKEMIFIFHLNYLMKM